MKTKQKHAMGWRPDLPDVRDFAFKAKLTAEGTRKPLPAMVDLRQYMPPVYDQGTIGSCTANAIAANMEFLRANRDKEFIIPSRLFIYYNERAMEGTVKQDAGAELRDGIKSVVKQGVCPEGYWGYLEKNLYKKPRADCYKRALKFQALTYRRIEHNRHDMWACLAEGYPFVFGATLYESFEETDTSVNGRVHIPTQTEHIIGGHAMLCVGYKQDIHGNELIVRNSWGVNWGQDGHCLFPVEYLENPNLADDFWAIMEVE